MPIGVFVNSAAVLTGGLLGAFLSNHLPTRLKEALPNVFGLASLTIGISLIIPMSSLSAVILALIIGTILGELFSLNDSLLKALHKIVPHGHSKEEAAKLETIISIIVLFCASGTGIFGAINSGLTGDHTILFAKSILDFFTAMIFGASLGMIIGFICIPQCIMGLLLFYGSSIIMPLVNDTMINDFKACGGILTLAVGLNILQIKSTKVLNMLPALFFVMPLSAFWDKLFS